jgi:hypothetical protein
MTNSVTNSEDIKEYKNIMKHLTDNQVIPTFNDLWEYLSSKRYIAKTEDIQECFNKIGYNVTFEELTKYLKTTEFPIKLKDLKKSLGYFGYCEEIFVFDENSKIQKHIFKYMTINDQGLPELSEKVHHSEYILDYDFIHYLTTLGDSPLKEQEVSEMIKEYKLLPDCKGIPIKITHKNKYKYFVEKHGNIGYGIHIDQFSRLILSK